MSRKRSASKSNLYRLEGNRFTLLCGEEERMPGKPYWGSGHARLIDAFYRSLLPGGEAFPSAHRRAVGQANCFSPYICRMGSITKPSN